MKGSIRTTTAAMAALLLVMGLAACGGTANSNDGKGTNKGDTSAKPADAQTQAGPVTIKVDAMVLGDLPAGFQNDPVMQAIEKKLNLKIDITPANSVGDVNTKFAAKLASGDLADIEWVPQSDMLAKVITAKAALPLDDLVDKNGPDIKANSPQMLEYSKKFKSVDVSGKNDGKLYYIGLNTGMPAQDPLEVVQGPYLRYDLWKQLGYPALNSWDDYLTVLKKMQDLEPKNSDGKPTYGVSAWFGDAGGWNAWPISQMAQFEGQNLAANTSWIGYDIKTTDVYPAVTDPNSKWWSAVEWFYKANKMGLLDPDAFTQKFNNFGDKVKANQIHFSWAYWLSDDGNKTFRDQNQPLKGFYQMPMPVKTDSFLMQAASDVGGNWMFISKNSKHPEEAMKFLNYLHSAEGAELIYNGIQGQTWNVTNNKPSLTDDALKNWLSKDYQKKTGMLLYNNLAGLAPGFVDKNYDTVVGLVNAKSAIPSRLTDLMKDADKHFNVDYPGAIYYDNKELKYTFEDTTPFNLMAPMPADVQATETKIDNYVNTNFVKPILSKNDDAFKAAKDKIINDVKGMGSDKVFEWYSTEYKKSKQSLSK